MMSQNQKLTSEIVLWADNAAAKPDSLSLFPGTYVVERDPTLTNSPLPSVLAPWQV